MNMAEWRRKHGVDTRAMAPTHPDAEAVHWPKPREVCETCGIAGHVAALCVTPEEDIA